MDIREYIIIENGIAKRMQETVVKQVREEDLVGELLKKSSRVETGLLPSGTLSFTRMGSVASLLMWRQGRHVTFSITKDLAEYVFGGTPPRPDQISLYLPPQVFGVKIMGSAITDVYMWFMIDEPSPDANVLAAAFPNQNSTGKMCLGTLVEGLSDKPLAQMCQAMVGCFYASKLNSDLGVDRIPHDHADKPWAIFLRAWSEMTKEQALAMKWRKVERLADLVARFR